MVCGRRPDNVGAGNAARQAKPTWPEPAVKAATSAPAAVDPADKRMAPFDARGASTPLAATNVGSTGTKLLPRNTRTGPAAISEVKVPSGLA